MEPQAAHMWDKLQRRAEISLISFLELCQPTLDPEQYENAEQLCRTMERNGVFRPGAVDRALDYLKRDLTE